MRYLELALAPGETPIHPLFPVMAEEFSAEWLDWNVQEERTTGLFRVDADPATLADRLDAEPVVEAFEVTPDGDRGCYAYIHTETQPVERRLFEAFAQERTLVVPPIEYADGTVTCRLLGTAAELRAVLDDVPDGIHVDVRRVGAFEGRDPAPADDLTDRQRDALHAAVAAGYYEVPREAGNEAVADALGCAPSTAAEHLRKAEARLAKAAVGEP